MIYLIEHLSLWLVLTAAFAGLAGWAFAGLRAHHNESMALRERDRLMRDVLAFSVDLGAGTGVTEHERELTAFRGRADLDAARIAELEQAVQVARGRAGEAAARVAELERAGARENGDAAELIRLREQVANMEDQQRRTIDIEPVVAPALAAQDDEHALQAWRLRYFEQRVRYLENNAPAALKSPDWEWRARTAEARVIYLENQVREEEPEPQPVLGAQQELPSPFAADAGTDMLMRWRMLYLEKRAAHLQQESQALAAPDQEEAEKWMWRARYLEARVRHLESQPQTIIAQARAPEPAPIASTAPEAVEQTPAPPPLVPHGSEERPRPLGAARDGAPDDFSLIEGVSTLQQRTLNSLGIYHFDQIAAWTPANVAWVDQYLRLRGRIVEEEWVEQAAILAREGPTAARRVSENEEV